MSQVNDFPEREIEAVNSRLNEGLKTCRSVVSNYKALLSPKQHLPAKADNGDDEETLEDSARQR